MAVAVRVGCGEGWIGFDSIRVAKREEQWDEWRQKETATAVSSSRLLFRQSVITKRIGRQCSLSCWRRLVAVRASVCGVASHPCDPFVCGGHDHHTGRLHSSHRGADHTRRQGSRTTATSPPQRSADAQAHLLPACVPLCVCVRRMWVICCWTRSANWRSCESDSTRCRSTAARSEQQT